MAYTFCVKYKIKKKKFIGSFFRAFRIRRQLATRLLIFFLVNTSRTKRACVETAVVPGDCWGNTLSWQSILGSGRSYFINYTPTILVGGRVDRRRSENTSAYDLILWESFRFFLPLSHCRGCDILYTRVFRVDITKYTRYVQ